MTASCLLELVLVGQALAPYCVCVCGTTPHVPHMTIRYCTVTSSGRLRPVRCRDSYVLCRRLCGRSGVGEVCVGTSCLVSGSTSGGPNPLIGLGMANALKGCQGGA